MLDDLVNRRIQEFVVRANADFDLHRTLVRPGFRMWLEIDIQNLRILVLCFNRKGTKQLLLHPLSRF